MPVNSASASCLLGLLESRLEVLLSSFYPTCDYLNKSYSVVSSLPLITTNGECMQGVHSNQYLPKPS